MPEAKIKPPRSSMKASPRLEKSKGQRGSSSGSVEEEEALAEEPLEDDVCELEEDSSLELEDEEDSSLELEDDSSPLLEEESLDEVSEVEDSVEVADEDSPAEMELTDSVEERLEEV